MMIFAWQSGYCYLLFPAQLPATLRCFILNRSSQNNLQETLFSLTLNNEFFQRKINYRARKEYYHKKIIIQLYFTCVVAVTEFEIWVSWPWKTFFTPVLGFEMATGEKLCIVRSEESILSCCPAR